MSIEIAGIILISALLLYWSNAKKAQEYVYQLVKNHCQQLQLQMLDDYVALSQLSWQRGPTGKIEWLRSYVFEFTSTGEERYQGMIQIRGYRVQMIKLEPYRIHVTTEVSDWL